MCVEDEWEWEAYPSNQQPVVLVQGKTPPLSEQNIPYKPTLSPKLFIMSEGNSEDELYLGLFALCLLFDAWDYFERDGTLRLRL